MSENRKLAAILAADVAGFSRLTATDEERTVARLRGLRTDLIDPAISVHHGRVVKRTGDGILIEFRSVVDAVRCAIEVQNGMVERNAGLPPERKILFRAGIHLGDVIEEADGDLMGDGINIAARLENICEPGAICLSEQAYWQVKSRLDLAVADLGAKDLKNIPEPVHVYSLEVGKPAQAKPAITAAPIPVPPPKKRSMLVPSAAGIAALLVIVAAGAWFFLARPGAPIVANAPAHLSIVVLPFANLSNDPKQDYFADGITENLTTDLSRIRNSFVIARNTAFTYKGKSVDAKQIGKQLSVRYILEGSVQRDGNRVRVNAQLIDAQSGVHLWADRFEEDLADLFKLQDDVVARLANTLGYELVKAEAAKSAHSANPDAIDLTMQGWALLQQSPTKEVKLAAQRAFEQALRIDPDNAEALAGEAQTYYLDFVYWNNPKTDYDSKILVPANRAIASASGTMWAYYVKSFYLCLTHRAAEGLEVADAGLATNPNLAPLYLARACAELSLGQLEQDFADIKQAMRLSPRDPDSINGRWHMYLGNIELALTHYDSSIDEESQAIHAGYASFVAYMHLAAAYALAGKMAEAKSALAEARRLNPRLTVTWAMAHGPNEPVMFGGLRKAGLPEDDGPRLSIVVLPFQNLSGDPKQDYLADVLTDELTTYISRIPGSFVIARNTAFTYKGKPTEVKTIGKDLGVRYALEGSVQPTDKRIRTNAQLIDTETGAHLWAEEFDTDKTDLLQTEDDIVTRLARTLQIQLSEIEAARLEHSNPGIPDAQELALRCFVIVQKSDFLDKEAGLGYRLCEKALDLDPKNVIALTILAHQAASRVVTFQSANKKADIERVEEFTSRALVIEPNNPYALLSRARTLMIASRLAEASIATERALALSPSLIDAYVVQDIISLYRFEPERTIESALKAMRLSPRDPQLYVFQGHIGTANFWLHRDDQAITWLRQSIALYRSTQPTYLYLIAALALNGHENESRNALSDYFSLNPRAKTVAVIKAATLSTDPRYFAMRERLFAGLRLAGMPEQ